MFAIIISEKGGAERREAFDKNEINVGRVQGNDLMLPKGNVSKHHARLLFRDGRFIVTDLKSTNGTYVNGRKIAQATIVREGDKIYIGDFVLRLESNGMSASEEPPKADFPPVPPGAAPPGPGLPGMQNPPVATLKAATHPPGTGTSMPRPVAPNVAPPATGPIGPVAPIAPASPVAPPTPALVGAKPNIPAPEESSQPSFSRPSQQEPKLAPTPQPMSAIGGRPPTVPLNQMAPAVLAPRLGVPGPGPGPAVGPAVGPVVGAPGFTPAPGPVGSPYAPPSAPLNRPEPPAARAFEPPPPEAYSAPVGPPPSVPPPQRISIPPVRREAPKETAAQAGRRLAVTMLIGRIGDAVDLSALRQSPIVPDALAAQIEKAAREQAKAMRDEGDAPQDVDVDAVARDAHRELVGLGAFGPLLEDEDVTEIHAVRHDQIFVVRGGAMVAETAMFSSEEALHRSAVRLAHQSGEPWRAGDAVVERKLPRASFVAIAPPAAANHVVSIRKRLRVEATLEDFSKSNSLSKAMAQFLEASVGARANVLVTGDLPTGFLAALAATVRNGQRVSVVQDSDEIAIDHAHTIALSVPDTRKTGEDCVRAAVRLKPDRLVVAHLAGGVAAATIDAIMEGYEGVLTAMPAPTLRQALSRLVAQIMVARPGLNLEATREIVGEAFDIAIEVGTIADGRTRILRIAELAGADTKGIVVRDVFLFTPDATGNDGSFSATGVVPRIANDLAARGMKLDQAMFKRGR